jgi:PPOX class probable F420-dependent enzyme
MRMGSDWARQRFHEARVARLATADDHGRPHLVPVVYAVERAMIFLAIDAKPKSGTPLRRLANIAANHRVSLLVDYYDDDWTQLWWARADGSAHVLEQSSPGATELLAERYRQYRDLPPAGPFITIEVERWSGWTAAER